MPTPAALRPSVIAAGLLLAALAALPARAQAPELKGHGGPVRAVIVQSDRRTVVTAGFDSAIIIWDTAAGTARRVLRFHDTAVTALASVDADCFLSGGEDTRIALWCGDAAEPRRIFPGHQGPVAAIAVAPDGKSFASASWDRQARLWPLDGSAATRVIEGHNGPINGVAFSRDGQSVVTAGYDGQVRLTPLDPARAAIGLQVETPVNAVVAAPDGGFLTAGADGRIRVLGPRLEPGGEIQLGAGPLTTIVLSSDGLTAATAGLRTAVTLIDVRARKVAAEILGPGLPIWSLAFGPDGRDLYTGGDDRAVRRWDAATARPAGEDLARPATTATAERSEPQHRGAVVFRACRACHGLAAEDAGRAGPTLFGLFGRRIATAPGFVYSEALRRMDIVWTPETVARLFEIGPNAMTPGTKMPEQTITNAEDRRALVEWLQQTTRQ